MQSKSVTIVQSRSLPFNNVYNDSFRKRALQVCQSIGINFIFEDYLDATEPTNGTITTRKGKSLRADVVVRLAVSLKCNPVCSTLRFMRQEARLQRTSSAPWARPR